MRVKKTDYFTAYEAVGYKAIVYNRGVYDGFDGDLSFKIDEGALRNKFQKPAGDRRRAVVRYEKWIRGKGGKLQPVQNELAAMWIGLKQRTRIGLNCCCLPMPCHGDILALLLLEWAHFERIPK